MAFETLPSIRHWAWFAGALNQYQTAFLLLAEVFSYPMRREADRIWRVLDYVFEPPPHLSRDEKSRLILTEIRDRMGIYRDARKLRAPVLMNKRMGIKPPVQRGEIGLQDEQEDKKPDLMYPSARGEKTHPEMVAIANEQEAQAQQAQAQTRRESGSPETGRSGSMSGTVGSGQDIAMPDDLMADIDWVRNYYHDSKERNGANKKRRRSGINSSHPTSILASSTYLCLCPCLVHPYLL